MMLTTNCLLAVPAWLVAVHEYEPASSRCALYICSWRPPSTARMFGSAMDDSSSPSRLHRMSGRGRPVAGQVNTSEPPTTAECRSVTRDPLIRGGTARWSTNNKRIVCGTQSRSQEFGLGSGSLSPFAYIFLHPFSLPPLLSFCSVFIGNCPYSSPRGMPTSGYMFCVR